MKCLETLDYYLKLGRETIRPEYLSSLRYNIIDPEKYEGLGLNDQQRTYWSEILQRSHWAAISSLQRNLKWMDGLSLSVSKSNMLLFTAALRGFVESCADSLTALTYLPLTLAEHFKTIQVAMSGQIQNNQIFVMQELEDVLIHFAFAKGHAKEEKSQAEKSHIAKTNTEYIKVLDQNAANGPVYKLYTFLCQFTHPAANTIFYSMHQKYENAESEFRFVDGDDKGIVRTLYEHDSAIVDSRQYSFNAAFVLLKLLNEFKYDAVRTPFADGFTFQDTKTWSKIKDMLMA